MIEPRHELIGLIRRGELIVDPVLDPPNQIQGAKIDLRLDNLFLRLREEQIQAHDPSLPRNFNADGHHSRAAPAKVKGERKADDSPDEPPDEEVYEEIEIGYQEKFILHPWSLVLAQTFEFVSLPTNCYGRLEGRSSLARKGILVHLTAGGVDPGFSGILCLEMVNAGKTPVILRPLMRVASLTVERMNGSTESYHKRKQEEKAKFGGYKISKAWKLDPDFRRVYGRLQNL